MMSEILTSFSKIFDLKGESNDIFTWDKIPSMETMTMENPKYKETSYDVE